MAPVRGLHCHRDTRCSANWGAAGWVSFIMVRDRETGEVVALKILKPEIAAHPQILERFKNELLLAHKSRIATSPRL